MKLVSLMLFSLSAHGAEWMGGSTTINGVTVNYETRLEPASPPILSKHGGGTQAAKGVIQRYLYNLDNNTYFGYDLTVEPLGEGRYRFRFAPLTITPREMTSIFKEVQNWTPLQLPSEPVTREIRERETMALDLFVHPSTGQKITDYLTIKGKEEIHVAGPARDFSVEDATIAISAAQLVIDGKEAASDPGSVSGPAVWIDIPGHGRFTFSLAPRPDLGMQKAGEIRGTKMTWRYDGHDYAITTGRAITATAQAYNLYMAHTPRKVDSFGCPADARFT